MAFQLSSVHLESRSSRDDHDIAVKKPKVGTDEASEVYAWHRKAVDSENKGVWL